jgi:hypothetical protein
MESALNFYDRRRYDADKAAFEAAQNSKASKPMDWLLYGGSHEAAAHAKTQEKVGAPVKYEIDAKDVHKEAMTAVAANGVKLRERVTAAMPRGAMWQPEKTPNAIGIPEYPHLGSSTSGKVYYRDADGTPMALVIKSSNFRPTSFEIGPNGMPIVRAPKQYNGIDNKDAFYAFAVELTPDMKFKGLNTSKFEEGVAFLESDMDKAVELCVSFVARRPGLLTKAPSAQLQAAPRPGSDHRSKVAAHREAMQERSQAKQCQRQAAHALG